MPNTQWHYCDVITRACNSSMFLIIAKKLVSTQQNQTMLKRQRQKCSYASKREGDQQHLLLKGMLLYA